MLNDNNIQSTSKKTQYREVIFIKLLILLVVLVLPVLFMMMDLGNKITYLTKPATKANVNLNQAGNQDKSDFEVTLPSDKVGNLSNVPKAEIDSLFSNLK